MAEEDEPRDDESASERWAAALYARPFLYMAVLLALLMSSRLALWAMYAESFAGLDAADTLRAFVRGLRIDISTVCWVLGIPVLALLWPADFARRRAWQTGWGWVACGLVLLMLLLSAADLVYFPTVGRHIGNDFFVGLAGNAGSVARSAFDYPAALAAVTAIALGVVAAWARWLRRPAPRLGRRALAAGVALAWLPLVVIGARGGLQKIPIALVDAFRGPSIEAGYLALNGPFSVFYSYSGGARDVGETDPVEAARDERLVRARFGGPPRVEWRGPEYPLQRRVVETPGAARPDVVVLVFEGLDVSVLDTYRRRAGLPELGVTPNLDRLASRGLLFTRLLAHGQLSIEGFGALLASFPSIPGLPVFREGLAQTRLQYLGSAAKSEGYATYFVRSAHRASSRIESLAALAGFDRYAGLQDIDRSIDSHTDRPYGVWGAWDFDTLRLLHGWLAADTADPVLGVFFGSSTHSPYPLPGDEWKKFSGEDERSRYLNAVHYVDWALGEFMALAEEAGYADETLWVITSDQASRLAGPDLSPERFAVPTLLIGPGIPRDSVDDRLASQLDILPTIIDAAGWSVSQASFGQSLLDDRTPSALVKVGELLLRADSSAWIVHSLEGKVDGGGPAEAQARLERLLLAEVGTLGRLVRENRVLER